MSVPSGLANTVNVNCFEIGSVVAVWVPFASQLYSQTTVAVIITVAYKSSPSRTFLSSSNSGRLTLPSLEIISSSELVHEIETPG